MPESEYEVELFRKQGFTRQTCAKCGKAFWSLGHHETCGEAPCQEYDFIGNSPFKKKLTYRAMREDFLSFLEQNGHARVKRYPIVARWRDDVFFVQASVYPFQPWVISGQASPPANPLAISQPCVRFVDVDNVGKTGQHFTMFEMMAHHAFNFPHRPIYWKDHTVELCQLFLTERLGIDPTLPRYKESWWEGGGNSGPCLEVVFGGAEAATLVFMQNRELNGHRVPMDTTVVDTGYGLERLTWLSQATTSSYEAVFGDALAYLKRATGAKRVDDRVLREYSKVAGMLKVESLADIREIRRQTAERVGIAVEELVAQVSPLEALYTICDHARALIFLLGDGVVPSNAREGYFARLLVRRGLRALKDLNITYTLADTVSFMVDQMREDYPEFWFNKGDILKLLKVEEARYRETLEKGRATVGKIAEDLKAAGKGFDVDTLIQLYDSHGLNPDVVREFTDVPVEIPDDFYARVAARHDRPAAAEPAKKIDVARDLPPTKLRVYEDKRKRSFRAEVLGHHQVRAKVMARDVAEKKFGFRLYQGGSVPGGELRVVEIPKWDVEACGGTHVSRTSDVSLIKILRSTRIQDGVVRLEYAAGKGALEAIRKQTEDLRRVGEILAAPADQIVPTAERIMGEWKELRKVAQKATDERAAAKTKQEIETAKGTWPIVKDEVAQGVGFMMSMSKATASEPRVTGIYWAAAPNDVKLVLTRGVEVPVDAAELVRTVAPEFRGKGGGKPDFAQASFPNVDMARAAAAKLEELIRKKLGIESG